MLSYVRGILQGSCFLRKSTRHQVMTAQAEDAMQHAIATALEVSSVAGHPGLTGSEQQCHAYLLIKEST
jgi:hypothetical protein